MRSTRVLDRISSPFFMAFDVAANALPYQLRIEKTSDSLLCLLDSDTLLLNRDTRMENSQ